MHSDQGGGTGTTEIAARPPEGGHEDPHNDDHGDVHAHLPPPSIWPVTTAGGVALAGTGLVTTWPLSAAGLFLMAYGIFNWVQELRHERHG